MRGRAESEGDRDGKGPGMNRRARVNYMHCRTSRGSLQARRNKIDDTVDPEC